MKRNVRQRIDRIVLLLSLTGITCAGIVLAGLTRPETTTHLPQGPVYGASAAPLYDPPEDNRPDGNSWALYLVNALNPLDKDYAPTLEKVRGYQVDERIAAALEDMLADCEAAGLSPMICSAYRTQEKQESLFARQVEKQKAAGLGEAAAVTAAACVVARPGTSEHQTGLAVDLCAKDYQLLDEGQEDTPEYQWLCANCAEYGFIVRYPDGKSDVTGVIYEPWHFRYVGRAAAREIMADGLCLEEYLSRA